MEDHYREFAHVFDELHAKEEVFSQRPFFKKLIQTHGIASCLDPACGTGWHLVMLDEMGLRCAGSDLSSAMLERARDNLTDRDVPLKQGDFRKLSELWQDHFDLVICMTTSLPHLLNDREITEALNSMYERLSPGGILVIDNGFGDRFFDQKPSFIPVREQGDQAFYFFLEYPEPKQVVMHILNVKHGPEGLTHTYDRMPYYAMRKSDLERCFESTDFGDVDYYGDFDRTPYSPSEHSRLISVAHKNPG